MSLRARPGDQPLPVPNDGPDIQSLVVADLLARRHLGIERYGTPLQPGNGRDALRDLYEELVDSVCYLKQLLVERDTPGMSQLGHKKRPPAPECQGPSPIRSRTIR